MPEVRPSTLEERVAVLKERDRLRNRVAELEGQLAEARETNTRLNRRVQAVESEAARIAGCVFSDKGRIYYCWPNTRETNALLRQCSAQLREMTRDRDAWEARAFAAAEEAAGAREALRDYGRHEPGCYAGYPETGLACTCGFDTALNGEE